MRFGSTADVAARITDSLGDVVALTRFSIILVCEIAILMAISAPVSATARQLSIASFGTSAGLADLDVNSVFVDKSGFVVAATEHGAFYFNGQVFKNLGPNQGLPDGGYISSIMEDERHHLVLAYSNAVFVATKPLSALTSPEDVIFTRRVVLPASPTNVRGTRFSVWSNQLLYADGELGPKHKGLTSFDLTTSRETRIVLTDAATRHPIPTENVLRVFGTGFSGGFDVALNDGRVCDFTAFRPDGMPTVAGVFGASGFCVASSDGVRNEPLLAAAAAPDGSIWFKSATSLLRLSRQHQSADWFSLPANVVDRRLASDVFSATPDGQIIVPGRDGFIYGKPGHWEWFGHIANMAFRFVTAIQPDRYGVWLSTHGNGLMFVDGLKYWANYNQQDGLPDNQIWAIGVTESAVWFATSEGLASLQGRDSIAHVDPDAGNGPPFIAQCGDNQLFVVDSKNSVIDIVGSEVAYPPLNTGVVRSIACAVDGTAWVGQGHGASRLELGTPDLSLQPVPAISGKVIAAYADRAHGLWYIESKHLCHYDGTRVDCPVTRWPDTNFDPRTVMTDGPGSVWVGGSGGPLYHVRLDARSQMVEHIDGIEPPAIVSNTVVALAHDRRGWIWVGTDQGASVFDGHRWTGVTMEDGLIWNDIVQDGIAIAPDDSVWFATSNGASHRMHPEKIFDRPPLNLVIISARIGNKPLDGSHPYTRRPVEIVFGTLNVASSSSIRFRYKLDGVDDTWVDTAQHIARYPSMPPGIHVFRVRAYDPITHQVSSEIAITTSIRAPWWRWWWIDVLGAILIGLLIYGGVRLRLLHSLRRERELEALVAERTRGIKAAQDALVIQATMDGLTQTYNRGAIQDRLDRALRRDVGCQENWLTIGLLDVDHFKRINDVAGHLAGDEVLREFGARLRAHALPEEHVGRYGGEEFLILVEGDPGHGHARLSRLKTLTTGRAFIFNNEAMRVTCSVGVAHARGGDTWQTLISRADASLYAAKQAGRDCIVDGEQDPRATAIAMRRARRRYRDLTA